MERSTQVLVAVLAVTDAISRPVRSFDGWRAAVVAERRGLHREAGVAWSSAAFALGSDVGDRKSAQRLLADLKLDGLLVASNPSGLRTVAIKLTPEGDAMARAVTGLPGMSSALIALDDLHRWRDDPRGFDHQGANLMPETALGRVEYGHPDAPEALSVQLEERMAPLLAAGLAVSQSSIRGHVWYGLTADGVVLAASREKVPAAATVVPPDASFDPEALDLYRRRFREETASLGVDNGGRRELGLLPIPVAPITRGQGH